ncbi:aspartate aminotransferase family protein [Alkalibacter mobilis]|uniref:aspartate aminotransferase family protein n=1 Tax=Alkalibacter mobilis TaxID=2787712 RepID=UPI0018A0C302|nr:aspartate aminotransferase family protein [Alkalibacter mobilis]MBF7096520.1 aspartate aminotransferase family protein [Alkalibacter mobilis]
MENKTIEKAKKHVMSTYGSYPIVFDHGKGCYLYDDAGKKYLDFVAGIAVNALGYGHEKLVEKISEQAKKLTHVSNLYYNEPAVELAEKFTDYAEMDKVFFCNSGAEAVEAALKLSRVYCKKNKSEKAHKIISMKNSFHGRTFGAISATGQTKYQKDLNPLMPTVEFAEFNNLDDVKSKINEDTAAIIVEPIQGEGGINPADLEFLKGLRSVCDDENIVLIFDEVQSGIGRTGKLFAYQKFGVYPDIVACAKGLGGGVPMGAILAKKEFADAFVPGSHASTFGGNALSASAALVVLDELMENGLMENVSTQGEHLKEVLYELKEKSKFITNVKGEGLMLGISVDGIETSKIVGKAMEKGLLLVGAGSNVIRFVPPLIVTEKEIDEFKSIMESVLEELE